MASMEGLRMFILKTQLNVLQILPPSFCGSSSDAKAVKIGNYSFFG
jgi:hypothetical protein